MRTVPERPSRIGLPRPDNLSASNTSCPAARHHGPAVVARDTSDDPPARVPLFNPRVEPASGVCWRHRLAAHPRRRGGQRRRVVQNAGMTRPPGLPPTARLSTDCGGRGGHACAAPKRPTRRRCGDAPWPRTG
jgi:hypothetical protein